MDTEEKVAFNWNNIIIVLVVLILGVGAIVLITAKDLPDKESDQNIVTTKEDQNVNMEELKIKDIETGEGEAVEEGDSVLVHYSGRLEDGTVFDSSYERDEPFPFTVGEGRVIEGWEKGLIGMKIGGKRELTIPPEMGYGEAGTPDGTIPPNSTLIFEVELIEIRS